MTLHPATLSIVAAVGSRRVLWVRTLRFLALLQMVSVGTSVRLLYALQEDKWTLPSRKGLLLHCRWRVSWNSHHGEQYGGALNPKNSAAVWACSPTPGHVSRGKHGPKGCMDSSVRCSAVYSGQDVEAPWMPVSRRMGKARRTQRDITQPLERVSNVVCSSVDGPRDRPVEWSQTEKEK